MAVTQDKAAPYAPASTIMSLIERHREKGLPTPITADVLARAGVSDSLNARTLYALGALDLIDEEGKPTAVFEGIRKAPQAEYQQRLADWLRDAYADALQYVDPTTASDTEIRDAFRSYNPVGQQNRMVTLFTGLFTAAGAIPDRKRQSSPRSNKSAAPSPKRPLRSSQSTGGKGRTQQQVNKAQGGDMPPALSGLLASLPDTEMGWTKAERDQFITTFSAVLDFCFPIRSPGEQSMQPEPEEDAYDEA